MENIFDLWNSVLKELEKKVSKFSYEIWLKFIMVYNLKKDVLMIIVLNEFVCDWLEFYYFELILEILYDLIGVKLVICFIIF